MSTPGWVLVQFCANRLEAQLLAGLLQSESVPVLLTDDGAVPGLEAGTCVQVPGALLHRARWLLAHAAPSEAELTFLAAQHEPDSS